MTSKAGAAKKMLELEDRGISLQFLIDFMDKETIDGVSVGDKRGNEIKNRITVPRTKESMLSYSEWLSKEGVKDSQGNPAIGKVRFFVSHAWSYEFKTLISSLKRWKKLNNFPDGEPLYLFVDYFTVNQNYPTEDLKGLSDMITKSQQVVLVLTPWDNPTPLTRAWCVYEIYKTAVKEDMAGSEKSFLMISMPDDDVKGFEEMLLNDYEGFVKSLSEQDVRKAVATVPSDQEMIEKEIKSTVGYTKVQKMVFRSIIKWMAREANKKLEELYKEFKSGNLDGNYNKKKELMKFAYYFGRYWRKDVGNLERAIETQKIVEEVGETMDKEEGPDGDKWDYNSQIIDAMTERSYCLNDQDENTGEFRSETINLKTNIAERCLKEYGLEGKPAKKTCKAFHAVARSLGETDPAFAAKINRLVYETRKKVLPENDRDIFNSLNELAENYVELGKLEVALKFQLKVLESRIQNKKMGKRHTRTARAKRKVGMTLHKMGDESALGYLRTAYKDSLELLGDSHKDSLETMEALLECLMAQDDPSRMLSDPKISVKDLTNDVLKKLSDAYQTKDATLPSKRNSIMLKEMNYKARQKIMALDLPLKETVMDGSLLAETKEPEAEREAQPLTLAKSLLMSIGKGTSPRKSNDEEKNEEPVKVGLDRKWTVVKGDVKGTKIKTLHWNILADKLSGLYDKEGSKKIFHKCPKEALKWEVRCPAIVGEIVARDPDVFTLCELDKFDDIKKALGDKYEGQVLLRKGKKDGSGIFWRAGMLTKKRELTTYVDVEGKQWEQVVLAVELATPDGKTFVQACSHLKSDKKPAGEILRQKQAKDVLKKIAEFFGSDVPLIFNIDLNSSNVPLYKGSRPLRADEEIGKDSYKPLVYPDILANETYGFTSAYKECLGTEPWATSSKYRPEGPPENPDKKYEYCIDFIFVSKQITPVSVLDVFSREQIPKDAFPSAEYPSDHELLAAELVL